MISFPPSFTFQRQLKDMYSASLKHVDRYEVDMDFPSPNTFLKKFIFPFRNSSHLPPPGSTRPNLDGPHGLGVCPHICRISLTLQWWENFRRCFLRNGTRRRLITSEIELGGGGAHDNSRLTKRTLFFSLFGVKATDSNHMICKWIYWGLLFKSWKRTQSMSYFEVGRLQTMPFTRAERHAICLCLLSVYNWLPAGGGWKLLLEPLPGHWWRRVRGMAYIFLRRGDKEGI